MNVHSLTFWSNQQREFIREESKRRGLRLFVFGVYKQETKKEGDHILLLCLVKKEQEEDREDA